MKTRLILIGLLVAGLLTAYFLPPVKAQSQRPQEAPENVALYCTTIDGYRGYYGIYVYLASSSSGAPVISHYWSGQPLVPIAQALADLRRLGYRIVHISPEARQYVLEK